MLGRAAGRLEGMLGRVDGPLDGVLGRVAGRDMDGRDDGRDMEGVRPAEGRDMLAPRDMPPPPRDAPPPPRPRWAASSPVDKILTRPKQNRQTVVLILFFISHR